MSEEEKYRKKYQWVVIFGWFIYMSCMVYFVVPDTSIVRLFNIDENQMYIVKIGAVVLTAISLYILLSLTSALNKLKNKSFKIETKDYKKHVKDYGTLRQGKTVIFDFNYEIKKMSNEQIEAQVDILMFSIKKSPATELRLNQLIKEALTRGMTMDINDGKGDSKMTSEVLELVEKHDNSRTN